MLDATARWEPNRIPPQPPIARIPLRVAVARGFMCRCPMCGRTDLFRGYLRVVRQCSDCGAPLGLARADDAPPYFTIFATGHVIVPGMLILERAATPPLWVHAAIWVPLALVMSLGLLRPIKGATVGLMMKLGMMKSDAELDA